MGTVLRLICAACVVCSLSGSTSASWLSQGSTYRDVVAGYRAGDAGAVERLMRMPEDGVTDAVQSALHMSDAAKSWDWKDLRAAAMLHTEAWYRALLDKRARRADFRSRAVRTSAVAGHPRVAWSVGLRAALVRRRGGVAPTVGDEKSIRGLSQSRSRAVPERPGTQVVPERSCLGTRRRRERSGDSEP
jgi:hypothetical protein